MNEQGYGIPYAMHVHDIEHFDEFLLKEAQMKHLQGWVVLHIGNDADGDCQYTMGKPRPQFCLVTITHKNGRTYGKNHPKTAKLWDHTKGEWYCLICEDAK